MIQKPYWKNTVPSPMLYIDEDGNELDISRIPESRLCFLCANRATEEELQRVCCVGVRFKHKDNPTFICSMFKSEKAAHRRVA